ncbi:hypothetical protein PMIN06_004477 [Paraphaeosphaeria minitans]
MVYVTVGLQLHTAYERVTMYFSDNSIRISHQIHGLRATTRSVFPTRFIDSERQLANRTSASVDYLLRPQSEPARGPACREREHSIFGRTWEPTTIARSPG